MTKYLRTMKMKGIYCIFILKTIFLSSLLFALSSASSSNAQDSFNPYVKEHKETYTLSVVPQSPPLEIHERWMPFVERLSKNAGVDIQLRVYSAFQQFEDDLMNGVPDLVFMNPYQAAVARKAQGYIPLVRDKREVKGIIFVRKDSPIRSIKELNNKEIAFVSPKTICSIILRNELLMEEKIQFLPRYMGTASNVYRNVILGKIPAGGTLDIPLNKEPPELRTQLRIIYETPAMASHPLSVHPRTPEKLRQAIINAVFSIARDREAHNILTEIQMPEPVKADYKRDYQSMERFMPERYVEVCM